MIIMASLDCMRVRGGIKGDFSLKIPFLYVPSCVKVNYILETYFPNYVFEEDEISFKIIIIIK